MQYIVMDCETGGLDCDKHSLLSVAMIKTTSRFQVIKEIEVKIKHDVFSVCWDAMETNNIDLRNTSTWVSPNTARTLLLDFLGVPHDIGDKDNVRPDYTVCGTNIQFDVGFMKKFLGDKTWNNIFFHRVEEITSNFRSLQNTGVVGTTRGYQQFMMLEALGVEFDQDKLHSALNDAQYACQAAREMTVRNDILKDALKLYVKRHGGDLGKILKAYHSAGVQKALKKLRTTTTTSSGV